LWSDDVLLCCDMRPESEVESNAVWVDASQKVGRPRLPIATFLGWSELRPELIPNKHHAIVQDCMFFEVMHSDICRPFCASGHSGSGLR
jgi:hypothetical protein